MQGPSSNPLPDWLSFNADTRTFTGRPRNADVGEYTILVSVEDQALSSQASFVLTVAVAANQAPVAPTLSAQTATEDTAFTYQSPVFTDPDNDTLTYSASLSDGNPLPSWLSFNVDTRTFAGTPWSPIPLRPTPSASQPQTMETPSSSSSASFTLTVKEVNDAPVAGDDTATVAEGGTLQVATSTPPRQRLRSRQRVSRRQCRRRRSQRHCLPLLGQDHGHVRPRRLRDHHRQLRLHRQRRLRHRYGNHCGHGLASERRSGRG